jgi:hypothetical protein
MGIMDIIRFRRKKPNQTSPPKSNFTPKNKATNEPSANLRKVPDQFPSMHRVKDKKTICKFAEILTGNARKISNA